MNRWAVILWGALALCVLPGCTRKPETFAGGVPAREMGAFEASLVGAWVRPIPGGQPGIEGLVLDGDGSLGLVGIHSMHGTSWRVEGKTLLIATNTTGDPEPREYRLQIALATRDTLTLQAELDYLGGSYTRGDGAAGVLSGTVTHAPQLALPSEATLHVELFDVSRTDVLDRLIARQIVPVAGRRMPIPFRVTYSTADIDPNFTYAVRPTIVAGGRPHFVPERTLWVLTRGNPSAVQVVLVPPREPEGRRPQQTAEWEAAAAVEPPATYSGVLSCRDCPESRLTLSLRPDGIFFLRQVVPAAASRPAEIQRDLGRWQTAEGGRVLVLWGGREAPWRFAVQDARTLRLLHERGGGSDPRGRYTIIRSLSVDPFPDPFRLRGMYTYLADAGVITECLTGRRFPAAPEAGNAALERAYSGAHPSPGAPLLVSVEGRFARRPRVDGPGTQEAVVVERFLDVRPGERCAFTHATASLEQTHWKLVELHGKPVQTFRDRREPYLRLLKDERRADGFAGCNQFSATYEVAANRLRITKLDTAPRACRERMDEERAFLRVLESAPLYEVSGENLTLSDGGAVLARFESVYFR